MKVFHAITAACLFGVLALTGCSGSPEQAATTGSDRRPIASAVGASLPSSGKAAGPQTGKPALDMAHIQAMKQQILAGQPAAH